MDDKAKSGVSSKHVGFGIGGGSLLAILYSIDPGRFLEFFSEALGHQLVQFSLVFSLAAFIHRRGMKKDMAGVTEAIKSLGDALRDDLKAMGNEVVQVKDSVSKINSRVEALEKLKE